MKRIRMILLALMAVFAMGVVGASAANAADPGTGTVSITIGSCDVTFETDGWVPTSNPPDPADFVPGWKTNVINVQAGEDCGVDEISGSGTIYKKTGGAARFVGSFNFFAWIIKPIFGVSCSYTGTLDGTWAYDANGNKVFNLSGTVNRTSGANPPCPATDTATLDATVAP